MIQANPAASFEPYRRRLLGLAYRMLGSMTDASKRVLHGVPAMHERPCGTSESERYS
jgi:hypothetical protein